MPLARCTAPSSASITATSGPHRCRFPCWIWKLCRRPHRGELGGGLQTRSLKLKSADGREFGFRPVDKDPSEALPPAYRGTVVDRLVQDATSAANPAAPMIAAALLDAVGVVNARPQLFVMADQDGLGEFRDAFNGTLGYLEERPRKDSPVRPTSSSGTSSSSTWRRIQPIGWTPRSFCGPD